MSVTVLEKEHPCKTCDIGWEMLNSDGDHKSCSDECCKLKDYYLGQRASTSSITFKVPSKRTTKEDLLKIIEEKERDIASLHEEIDKLEKYKAFEEGAEGTKALYDSFINAGFSEDQAFKLTRDMIANVLKSSMINVKF